MSSITVRVHRHTQPLASPRAAPNQACNTHQEPAMSSITAREREPGAYRLPHSSVHSANASSCATASHFHVCLHIQTLSSHAICAH